MPELLAVQSLREELLGETISWCRNQSKYYRQRFADAGEVKCLTDMPKLPVLFREDVVDNHAAILCDPSLPAAVQHTTGTTGAFLQLHRSAGEQKFIWDFFSARLCAAPMPNPRPLYLSLSNAYHGSLIGMPTSAYTLSAGVHDMAQAQQARGLLERRYNLPGVAPQVSLLMGTERMVKALTAYLLADGYDLKNSPVRHLALFGGHVTPARKRLLARLWQADVHDQYSMTEMFGGATEAGIGGPWVFDPHVIPEVVHPDTHEPVTEGVGVLLLTGLYPFVQQMPLVRYFTGDLVEVTAPVDSPAGLQVYYKGRISRSVLDTNGPVLPLLLSGPLYEALEAIPDIAISPRFPDLQAGSGLELTGDLHYDVAHSEATDDASEPESITIRLGLRYAPWMYPDRVREVVANLTQQLFESHPETASRCVDGRLKLSIIPCEATEVPPYDSK